MHQRRVVRASLVGTMLVGWFAGGANGQAYTVVELEQLPDSLLDPFFRYSEPAAIAADGRTVGYTTVMREILRDGVLVTDRLQLPIVWDSAGAPTELAVLAGDEGGRAFDITDGGRVAGESKIVRPGPFPGSRIEVDSAVFWEGAAGPTAYDSLVTGGAVLSLREAVGVSGSGYVTGLARQDLATVGFVLQPDGFAVNLGLDTAPSAVNESGAVVGEQLNHAFMWQGGVLTDLHDPAEIPGGVSRAFDVNDSGVVCGEGNFNIGSGPESACIWRDGQVVELGSLGGAESAAWGINNHDRVVGEARDASGEYHAFLWEDGTMADLNSLIPAGSDWELLIRALDVNDSGQIVGVGRRSVDSSLRIFLMSPAIDGCPCEFGGDQGAVDIFDLLAFLDLWFAMDAGANFDGMAGVDIFDLLAFLDCWFAASAGVCP